MISFPISFMFHDSSEKDAVPLPFRFNLQQTQSLPLASINKYGEGRGGGGTGW